MSASAHYVEFFTKVKELLADDGVMLLHSIGRMEPPGGTNTWLRKYIFPGGYTPALSEVLTAIEKVGLWVTDIEILRLHYAETLRHWRQRFLANRERIKQSPATTSASAACGSSISPAARSPSGT